MNQEILLNIIQELKKEKNNIEYGLYCGTYGIAFFLFLYAVATENEEIFELAEKEINKVVKNIYIDENIESNCIAKGNAGILWGLKYCKDNDILEIGDDFFDEVNEFLVNEIHKSFGLSDYDFFHGTLGIAYYLSYFSNVKSEIEKYVLKLKENTVFIGCKGYVKSSIFQFDKEIECISLTMAHGLAGIICVLTKFHQRNIAQKDCKFLISSYIKFIKEELKKYNYKGLIFDFDFNFDLGYREAWCSGKITIWYAILLASKELKNSEDYNLALSELINLSSIRNINSLLIEDACLCHGTAGLMQIYYKLFIITNRIEFYEAYKFWKQKTIEFANIGKDGNLNYLFKFSNQEIKERPEFNILNGIAGVGLALLTEEYIKEPTWDEMFLLI